MQVVSFLFDEKQQIIEVVFRQPSNMIHPSNPPKPVPDTIWREVYGVVDGRIEIIRKDKGRHVPAHHVNESISFDPA